MSFDFDRVIDRAGTSASKWEFRSEKGTVRHWDATDIRHGKNRVLPMWVADMDFRCPEPVIEAMTERARHGIYGYTGRPARYIEAVTGWMDRRHGWQVDPDAILTVPGVVPAINVTIQSLIEPGDKVLVQPPVYYPFYRSIQTNGGEIVRNPLILRDGRYDMDFENLERKTADPKVKIAILCSPHNPVGRVWTADELRTFGEICMRNDVLVIADEIHGDLILPGNTFTAYATLGETFERRSIICTAASKTFNLAGLHCSNIMIADETTRQAIAATILANGQGGLNPFSLIGTEVAYREGDAWLDAVLAYIAGNADRVAEFMGARIPEISVIRPQGTYLLWFDCRKLGLDADGLEDLMLNKARIYFDEGYIFGPEGEGFERINLACPRSIVDEALNRIERAVADLRG